MIISSIGCRKCYKEKAILDSRDKSPGQGYPSDLYILLIDVSDCLAYLLFEGKKVSRVVQTIAKIGEVFKRDANGLHKLVCFK